MKHVYAVLAILLATLIAFTGSVNAQPATPFGLEAGQSIEGLECVKGELLYSYVDCIVPKPHPIINEGYAVNYHPVTGIYRVFAISVTIPDDHYGLKVTKLIDKVAGQIASRYGEWDRFVDENMDVEYTRPEQWAGGVYRNNRFYIYGWLDVAQHGLESIGVWANADARGGTWVSVEFVFTNKEEVERLTDEEGAATF